VSQSLLDFNNDGRCKSRGEAESSKRNSKPFGRLRANLKFKQLQKKKAGGKPAGGKAKKPKDDEPKESEATYAFRMSSAALTL
jgi:hypothetical protein